VEIFPSRPILLTLKGKTTYAYTYLSLKNLFGPKMCHGAERSMVSTVRSLQCLNLFESNQDDALVLYCLNVCTFRSWCK